MEKQIAKYSGMLFVATALCRVLAAWLNRYRWFYVPRWFRQDTSVLLVASASVAIVAFVVVAPSLLRDRPIASAGSRKFFLAFGKFIVAVIGAFVLMGLCAFLWGFFTVGASWEHGEWAILAGLLLCLCIFLGKRLVRANKSDSA